VSLLVGDTTGGGAQCVERKLADMTPYVLRQFWSTPTNRQPNVLRLPLGYGFGRADVTRFAKEIVPSSRREVDWVYIGAQGEREDLDKGLGHLRFEVMATHDPLGRMNLYGGAKFAPIVASERNTTVEHHRIYEASRAGCIPIVVAEKGVIAAAFGEFPGAEGKSPPWIIATSWTDAGEQMRQLHEHAEELDKRQHQVMAWWRTVLAGTAARLRQAVEADYLQRQTRHALGRQWRERGREDVASRFLNPILPFAGMSDLSIYEKPP
jgi:hypothetical protein